MPGRRPFLAVQVCGSWAKCVHEKNPLYVKNRPTAPTICQDRPVSELVCCSTGVHVVLFGVMALIKYFDTAKVTAAIYSSWRELQEHNSPTLNIESYNKRGCRTRFWTLRFLFARNGGCTLIHDISELYYTNYKTYISTGYIALANPSQLFRHGLIPYSIFSNNFLIKSHRVCSVCRLNALTRLPGEN